jgi:hypothetical protein
LIFGTGASAALGKPYGLSTFECCELVRVALRSHEAPISRILSIALKMIKRKNPGLRLCVSFADPYHAHLGTIYQAANWTYTGTTGRGVMYRLHDGSLAHIRRFSGTGWNAPQPIPRGAERVITPGKHRYIWPFDTEMREKVEALRKPYPKKPCAGSVEGDASTVQVEEGGSIPTPAL